MDRTELKEYIEDNYCTEPDYPWGRDCCYEVFRHNNNKKWFALVTDIPKGSLGLREVGMLSIVNLKCDPVLIGALLPRDGFFPAYHMSKSSWITIALNGSVPGEEIKMLLDMSFEATAVKAKGRKDTENTQTPVCK